MNRNTKQQRNILAMAVAMVLGAMAMPAMAEDDPQSTGSQAQDGPTTLDKLTVTAQKREEQLQDVPITMSVLPERLLQDAGRIGSSNALFGQSAG